MTKKEQALFWLNEIKHSVQKDVEPILKVYLDESMWLNKDAPGFWTLPRILFPEIDGLARLRYGRINDRGSGKDIVSFMRNYFPGNNYKKVSGFLYYIFRLGLLHSHFPKQVLIDGKPYGWSISLGNTAEMELKMVNNDLRLDAVKFYRDFLKAIDKFIEDINDSEMEQNLVSNFFKAFPKMFDPSPVHSRQIYIEDSDLNFLKGKKSAD